MLAPGIPDTYYHLLRVGQSGDTFLSRTYNGKNTKTLIQRCREDLDKVFFSFMEVALFQPFAPALI